MHLTAEDAIDRISHRVIQKLLPHLNVLDSKKIHPPLPEKVIGKKDVSRLLKISLTTVTNWMKAGILPYYRKGSRVFFKEAEVLACLEMPKFFSQNKR